MTIQNQNGYTYTHPGDGRGVPKSTINDIQKIQQDKALPRVSKNRLVIYTLPFKLNHIKEKYKVREKFYVSLLEPQKIWQTDLFKRNYIRFIDIYKEFLPSNWRIHRNIYNT